MDFATKFGLQFEDGMPILADYFIVVSIPANGTKTSKNLII